MEVLSDVIFYASVLFGGLCVVLGLFILLMILWGKFVNLVAQHWNVMWNVYEYAFYKKEFNKWLTDNKKERNPKSKKYGR